MTQRNDPFLAAHRDPLNFFCNTSTRDATLRFMWDGRIKVIAGFIGVDPAALGRMARSLPAAYLERHEIEPVIETAFKYKQIAKVFPADELISPVALRA